MLVTGQQHPLHLKDAGFELFAEGRYGSLFSPMNKLAPMLLALAVLAPVSAQAADMVLQKTVIGGVTWLAKAFNLEKGPWATLKLFQDANVVCQNPFSENAAFGNCVISKVGESYWDRTLKQIKKTF